jgi:phosphatidylglycerophosphate synthase
MSKGRRLAISGAALTALLVLVAVGSRAHRPVGGSGAPPSDATGLVGNYILVAIGILLPFGALLVLWTFAYRRHELRRRDRASWWQTAITVVLMSGLLVVLFSRIGPVYVRPLHPPVALTPGHHQPPPTGRRATVPQDAGSGFDWLTVYVFGMVLLGLVVLVVGAVVLRRRWSEELNAEATLAAALDEIVKDTLEDLHEDRDPRRAVIRAYARMEKTFAAYGVPRHPAEAPFDYVARVLDRLAVSAYEVERLTNLFAWAKFSNHEIDAGMKDEAVAALAGLRAELEDAEEAA